MSEGHDFGEPPSPPPALPGRDQTLTVEEIRKISLAPGEYLAIGIKELTPEKMNMLAGLLSHVFGANASRILIHPAGDLDFQKIEFQGSSGKLVLPQ